jgi:hypothetical protein
MTNYTYTQLDAPSATAGTSADGISNTGEVVGTGFTDTFPGYFGYTYSGGSFTTVGIANPTGVNSSGEIIGVNLGDQGTISLPLYGAEFGNVIKNTAVGVFIPGTNRARLRSYTTIGRLPDRFNLW